ncbi:MAG: hypothetical protein ACREDK_08135 [Thermoplasmata archaeon]
MDETREQARLRQHLAEMGRAARMIGKDVTLDARDLEAKIARLPTLTAREAKYAVYDIEDGMTLLGHRIGVGAREMPGKIRDGLDAVGTSINTNITRATTATGQALEYVGHKTKEGTRNALAAAAGVKRTPIKEWSTPSSGSSDDE